MKIYGVKFISWDSVNYFLSKDSSNNPTDLLIGDKVIVENMEVIDIAEICEIKEYDQTQDLNPIIRHANDKDLAQSKKNNINNDKILKDVRNFIKKQELEMKLVDLHISLDNTMMVFSFVADGRVDFRELVKSISKKYKKKIRLYQIGVRDEAKSFGDIGECGQVLCCKRFLKTLESINTSFARDQQVAHRGLEKLSGMCGRLKCCLAYEEDAYRDLLVGMPEVGDIIKTKHGEGEVIELMPLKRSYKVKLNEDQSIIIINLE
ncbi:MAG TPA: regulatory iron-sulfur-containing complex subunit RicT [bacterium]|jgi:cell fate regulator YaaT (PSP1 superfamily)|nr:regulatory iron-sulfur-containing complex subunit RicT [bacterium]HOG38725.1 regulatory iron-sulfur-containing complex subunit RicT [bacterium]HQI03599.1 regulatory iron-sulfur-containing complex subunit RicT [bacterium]